MPPRSPKPLPPKQPERQTVQKNPRILPVPPVRPPAVVKPPALPIQPAMSRGAGRPQARAVVQPLTYSRFQGRGWWLFTSWTYNDQEERLNALEKRLVDAVNDTKAYFSQHRGWIPEPMALYNEVEAHLGGIRRGTHSRNDYDDVERQLNRLLQRFDQLSTGWARIDQWTRQVPRRNVITAGMERRGSAVYWNTHLYDMRDVQDRKRIANELFRRFVGAGFRYDANLAYEDILGTDEDSYMTMVDPMTLERHGSCITLSTSFARILNDYGVEAETKWVMGVHDSFIIRLRSFIDPSVFGNLVVNGLLRPGYYVFTGHMAVKVKGIDEYYDPMAKTTYTSIRPSLECRLTERGSTGVFDIDGACASLPASSRTHHVRVDATRRTGGLAYYRLVPN